MCDVPDSSFDVAGATAKVTNRKQAAAGVPSSTTSSESSTPTPTVSGPGRLRSVLVPLLCGGVFGAAFQASRVHEFGMIRAQMTFSRFLMLKMFLSAAASSMVVLAVLPLVSRRARKKVDAKRRAVTSGTAEARGLLSVAVGAGLLGAGMAFSGSCPGTVFAQLASGSLVARYVLLGGLGAATLFPLLDYLPGWSSFLRVGPVPKVQNHTLASIMSLRPEQVALPLAGALVSLVAVLEYLAPWKQELLALQAMGSAAGKAAAAAGVADGSVPGAIPPWMAGAFVGLLQLPLLTLVDQMLGSSSSYVTTVSNALGGLLGCGCGSLALGTARVDKVSGYRAARRGPFALFQVLLMAGVFGGALLTSHLSGSTFLSERVVSSRAEAALGGFLLVFGARLAGGCTSGHGISGFGLLALNSVIAVPAMFGTGILVASLRA
jgi:uncharacterized membrane protein YedE/YeeE